MRLYRVRPDDWNKFSEYRQNRHESKKKRREPPGALVFSATRQVGKEPDQLAETRIDLEPALNGGCGQVVVLVEGVNRE